MSVTRRRTSKTFCGVCDLLHLGVLPEARRLCDTFEQAAGAAWADAALLSVDASCCHFRRGHAAPTSELLLRGRIRALCRRFPAAKLAVGYSSDGALASARRGRGSYPCGRTWLRRRRMRGPPKPATCPARVGSGSKPADQNPFATCRATFGLRGRFGLSSPHADSRHISWSLSTPEVFWVHMAEANGKELAGPGPSRPARGLKACLGQVRWHQFSSKSELCGAASRQSPGVHLRNGHLAIKDRPSPGLAMAATPVA